MSPQLFRGPHWLRNLIFGKKITGHPALDYWGGLISYECSFLRQHLPLRLIPTRWSVNYLQLKSWTRHLRVPTIGSIGDFVQVPGCGRRMGKLVQSRENHLYAGVFRSGNPTLLDLFTKRFRTTMIGLCDVSCRDPSIYLKFVTFQVPSSSPP
jgi:hypothetical protein